MQGDFFKNIFLLFKSTISTWCCCTKYLRRYDRFRRGMGSNHSTTNIQVSSFLAVILNADVDVTPLQTALFLIPHVCNSSGPLSSNRYYVTSTESQKLACWSFELAVNCEVRKPKLETNPETENPEPPKRKLFLKIFEF